METNSPMLSYVQDREQIAGVLRNFLQWGSYSSRPIIKPGTNHEEAINNFLSEQASMEKAYTELADWQKRVAARNRRILHAIARVCGKTFARRLSDYIADLNPISWAAFEITRTPRGCRQAIGNEFGRKLRYEWIDQRSVGDSGDSFEGTATVAIDQKRYLVIHYSC